MLRLELSRVVRDLKTSQGLTYKVMRDLSGCSNTTIRYALNGGDGVSIEAFDKIISSMGGEIILSIKCTVIP